jgi:hypothetical protein
MPIMLVIINGMLQHIELIWYLRFWRPWLWDLLSSTMWRHVVWLVGATVPRRFQGDIFLCCEPCWIHRRPQLQRQRPLHQRCSDGMGNADRLKSVIWDLLLKRFTLTMNIIKIYLVLGSVLYRVGGNEVKLSMCVIKRRVVKTYRRRRYSSTHSSVRLLKCSAIAEG